MRAPDLVTKKKQAERDLLKTISRSINVVVDDLINQTGLVVSGISIEIVEVTGLGDSDKKFKVNNVELDVCLPD